METMMLEEVRALLIEKTVRNRRGTIACPAWAKCVRDAIDAAIRERDELRDRLDSALGDRISEFRRANGESRRADKAEACVSAAIRERDALRDAKFLLEREVENLCRELDALEARNG